MYIILTAGLDLDSPHFKGLTAILAPRLVIIAFKTVGDSHRESVMTGFSEEVEFRLRDVNADGTLSTDLQKECSRRRNGRAKALRQGWVRHVRGPLDPHSI